MILVLLSLLFGISAGVGFWVISSEIWEMIQEILKSIE